MEETRNDARPAGEVATDDPTAGADRARPGDIHGEQPRRDRRDVGVSKARDARPESPALIDSSVEPSERETL